MHAKKNEVGDAPDDPDDAGEEKVVGVFIQPGFFPDGERPAKMPPEKGEDLPQILIHQAPPMSHVNNI